MVDSGGVEDGGGDDDDDGGDDDGGEYRPCFSFSLRAIELYFEHQGT